MEARCRMFEYSHQIPADEQKDIEPRKNVFVD